MPGVYSQVRDLGKSTKRAIRATYIAPPGAPPPPPIITEDLLIYLDAGDVSSYPGTGTTWYDISGNDNHFTISGSTYSAADGGTILFDGVDDYVFRNFDWRRSHTFEVWVKYGAGGLSQTAGSAEGLFGQGTNNFFAGRGIRVVEGDGLVSYAPTVYPQTGVYEGISTALDTWYQYVFTYDHTASYDLGTVSYTRQVYRNGEFLQANVSPIEQYTGTGTFRIGQTFSPEIVPISEPLSGSIALFRAYGRILSGSEISQNYQATITRFYPSYPAFPSIVTDGLLLHLDADNPSSYPGSGTTWTDLTGNGYNGTFVNTPIYSSSMWGGVINLDGGGDQINIAGVDLRNNFSLEMWVRYNAEGTRGLFGQGIAAANQSINIWQGNAGIDFRMYFNDYAVSTAQNIYDNTSNWYHYVFTYNHSSYVKQIYRNGVLLGQSGTQGQYQGTGTLYVGSIGPSGESGINGSIAKVRVYSKVLSSVEVLQNYNAHRIKYFG